MLYRCRCVAASALVCVSKVCRVLLAVFFVETPGNAQRVAARRARRPFDKYFKAAARDCVFVVVACFCSHRELCKSIESSVSRALTDNETKTSYRKWEARAPLCGLWR